MSKHIIPQHNTLECYLGGDAGGETRSIAAIFSGHEANMLYTAKNL